VEVEGQLWHVPAGMRDADIPLEDPVGDSLLSTAEQIAGRYSLAQASQQVQETIRRVTTKGIYWLARLLRRQDRGRFVDREIRDAVPDLDWHHHGPDATDPNTDIQYEVLSGTHSNLSVHARRAGMNDRMWRFIPFPPK